MIQIKFAVSKNFNKSILKKKLQYIDMSYATTNIFYVKYQTIPFKLSVNIAALS